MIHSPSTRLLSSHDVHRMREAGILSESDRVELIHGRLITMSPKGSKHSNAVNRIARLLTMTLHDRAVVHNQNSIHLADHSEPEPDLTLLRPPLAQYDERLPSPADILLVIEVADSSLEYDRTEKVALDGAAQLPEYWIVNLRDQELEVYQQPVPDGYLVKIRKRLGDEVALPGLDAVLAVAEMFPPQVRPGS